MFIWKSIKPFLFCFILISSKEKKVSFGTWHHFPFLIVSLPHLQGQKVKDGGKSELGEELGVGMYFLHGKL